MMAIADLFEVLTAWDRPCKAPKTRHAALKIMESLKRDNH